MKYVLVICCACLLFSCKEKFDSKNYNENKISLAQHESENPQQFIHISSDEKRNLFGNTVIKGTLVNTASVAAYKNTRIKMLCYANGVRVEEHEDVIPDLLKPGVVKNFKLRYHLPKNTDSLDISVMSADGLKDTIASSKK